MQISIALLSWLALRIMNAWIRNVIFVFFLLSSSWKSAWSRSQALQERFKHSKQSAVLLSALVEFQKAQCFFLLAIGIASLIGTSSADAFSSTTWVQLSANIRFVSSECVLGVLLLSFTLFNLHRAGKKSVYVFILTLFTVGLLAVTSRVVKTADPTDVAPDLAQPGARVAASHLRLTVWIQTLVATFYNETGGVGTKPAICQYCFVH